MTGFGEARRVDDRMTVTAELRTVNNRHFKLSARLSDAFASFEPEIERLIREKVRRGSIVLGLRVERPKVADDYKLNLTALGSYREQLAALGGEAPRWSDLLSLPGVVEERRTNTGDPDTDWPVVERVLVEAIDALQDSRAREGRAMAVELLQLGRSIAERLERVAVLAPAVVVDYEKRLRERIGALIADKGVTLEPKDLIREVAFFAERADIAEEITRLRSHLAQYVEVIESRESAGKKLEFIVQEMGRETNTIGSKAGDVSISREVVEMKGLLERIRELIQNVE